MNGNKNIIQVVNLLIKGLGIHVTKTSITNEIGMHPEYPSLLAISDVLDNWSIPNSSFELTPEELVTVKLPFPFIAHSNKDGGEFLLVNHIDKHQAVISNQNWKKRKVSFQEFKDVYSGSILVAEKDEVSGEQNYNENNQKEIINYYKKPAIFSGAFVTFLIYLYFYNTNSLIFSNVGLAFLILFKTIGVIISFGLLLQNIDSNNSIIQKICDGMNTSCSSILNTKAARLNKYISWAEVGFLYFTGTWLVIIFMGNNIEVVKIISIVNLMSLPFTFYSIYYQWSKKKWCLFCCLVQILLWLEFVTLFRYIEPIAPNIGIRELAGFSIAMLTPLLLWVLIKPYLLESKQLKQLKLQFQEFKYNRAFFEEALNKEMKYKLPSQEHTIVLGNPEANNTISIVSNPFCRPCSAAHTTLVEWIDKRDDINLQIIFATSNLDSDEGRKVASHMMSLRSSHDEDVIKNALDSWHEQKEFRFEKWAEGFPLDQKENNKESLIIQNQWCEFAIVNATPSIFINGQRIPKLYELKDIKYFL